MPTAFLLEVKSIHRNEEKNLNESKYAAVAPDEAIRRQGFGVGFGTDFPQ